MHTTPTYLEIGTKNSPASAEFFKAVFDWTYTGAGQDGGWFQTPTIRVGLHGDDPQPQIVVYFSVPDLEAAIARVRAAGGHADEPGPHEPGFGRFCNCRDPGGVPFGLHQAPDVS